MRLLKLASLLLCAICFNVRGDAQSPDIAEKPVWTLEFIQVTPNGLALGYLDDHWMRVREEAKRQGAVLSYHRISEVTLETPGFKTGDPNSMVLLTEYRNLPHSLDVKSSSLPYWSICQAVRQAWFRSSEKAFLKPWKHEYS